MVRDGELVAVRDHGNVDYYMLGHRMLDELASNDATTIDVMKVMGWENGIDVHGAVFASANRTGSENHRLPSGASVGDRVT